MQDALGQTISAKGINDLHASPGAGRHCCLSTSLANALGLSVGDLFRDTMI
jgi:hypothetical protein